MRRALAAWPVMRQILILYLRGRGTAGGFVMDGILTAGLSMVRCMESMTGTS
jgi:hypothetical protein